MNEFEAIFVGAGDHFNRWLQQTFIPALDNPFSWPYLVFYVLVAWVYHSIATRTNPLNIRKHFQLLFPSEIYGSKSFLFELRYYFVIGAIEILLPYTYFYFVINFTRDTLIELGTFAGLNTLEVSGHTIQAQLIYISVSLILLDFSFYLAHFIQHKVLFFWEFHKVHHSAEALTPFTNFRAHPMDRIMRLVLTNIFFGVGGAVLIFIFGADFSILQSIDFGALIVLFTLTVNFQHSHLPISFGPIFDRFLVSPAVHQIHHSLHPAHHDKNFGKNFTVWDWMFGTLALPQKNQALRFGLENQQDIEDHRTVLRALWTPFVRVARLPKKEQERSCPTK